MAAACLWVQLFLALGWTVYVIFLPALAAQAGLDANLVPWLLLADQAIFAVMDWTLGTMADRMAGTLRRLGNAIALMTLVSCGAFIALPLVAPAGSPRSLVAVTIVWSATSSALRAPPWVLIGRHVPGPSQPWAAGLFLLGLGIAGAVSPYLAVTLKGADPRWPFALASIALAAATLVMTRAIEANPSPAAKATAPGDRPLGGGPVAMFLVAVALLGLGFQVHFAINSAPGYLRFAKPEELSNLMPVFWVGFNLLILPASFLARRLGGLPAMALGAAVGGIAAAAATGAGSLPMLLAAQFAAGAGWGCVMMSALAALAMGRTGREGFVTGGLWSLLALAAFARIGAVIAQVPKDAAWKPILAWVPGAMWLTAGLLLVSVAASARQASPRAA